MQISVAARDLAICRLEAGQEVPTWAWRERALLSLTYTADELSIVCPAASVPEGVRCERGWAALKILGPLNLTLTGILASLLNPLAAGGVAIFALSTFDTDYILVREHALAHARALLEQAGHTFV